MSLSKSMPNHLSGRSEAKLHKLPGAHSVAALKVAVRHENDRGCKNPKDNSYQALKEIFHDAVLGVVVLSVMLLLA